jgi:hypothetical protein
LATYYYLVSTLPMVFFDSENFPEEGQYLTSCRDWLTPHDMDLLESADIDLSDNPATGCHLLDSWNNWVASLTYQLALLRASAKGKETERFNEYTDVVLGHDAVSRDALAQSSPLNAEEMLDKTKWEFLDFLEGGHFFDIEKLIIYYLKIQILNRKKNFTIENGRANYNALYEKITLPFGESGVESI